MSDEKTQFLYRKVGDEMFSQKARTEDTLFMIPQMFQEGTVGRSGVTVTLWDKRAEQDRD